LSAEIYGLVGVVVGALIPMVGSAFTESRKVKYEEKKLLLEERKQLKHDESLVLAERQTGLPSIL
jgi:hypothetical protein